MYCSNCGEKVEGKFCMNCGTKAGEIAKIEEMSVANHANEIPEVKKDNFFNKVLKKTKELWGSEKVFYESKPKKIIILIVVAVVLIWVLLLVVGLGSGGSQSSSDSSDSSYTSTVMTAPSAISEAKNAFYLDQRICGALNFKQFYPPDFGVCDAVENSDGSWTVTLKGNMTGYLDEYQLDFETRKFEAVVEVSGSGVARVRNVTREY